MTYQSYITLDPSVLFGRPCIEGTRISVYDILSWLAQGMVFADMLEDFPELEQAPLLANLS